MATPEEIERANAQGRALRANRLGAVAARYDDGSGKVVVTLDNGIEICFAPALAQGLEGARPEQLASIEISPSGFGLYFPDLDADLYLPALLDGVFGSQGWTAARMGEVGGRVSTQAKAAAARANGRLGGRPRKRAAS
jgi:hypothetical protein